MRNNRRCWSLSPIALRPTPLCSNCSRVTTPCCRAASPQMTKSRFDTYMTAQLDTRGSLGGEGEREVRGNSGVSHENGPGCHEGLSRRDYWQVVAAAQCVRGRGHRLEADELGARG